MRISRLANVYLISTVLALSLLIALSSGALNTMGSITEAERNKYSSLKLANELLQSSEDLTIMARNYVVTGTPIYEQRFYEILNIRNGIRPRPKDYSGPYWYLADQINSLVPTSQEAAIPLVELMRKEGLSDRELHLLEESQANSDELVGLEKQAFSAMKGLYADGQGNYTLHQTPDREFAIQLLFGNRYSIEKNKIMKPITQFKSELDNRTQTRLTDLQGKFEDQVLLILLLLFIMLAAVAIAAMSLRRNILKPLRDLSQQASSIAGGSYSSRCEIHTKNEINDLGNNFNIMAETIEQDINKLKQIKQTLTERLKELNCLYAIHREMESSELDIVLKTVSHELVLAMSHPEDSSVTIEIDGNKYFSDSSDTHYPRELKKQITVSGKLHGSLSVFVKESRDFLIPEESELISVVADRLGRWLERKEIDKLVLVEHGLRIRNSAISEFVTHLEQMRESDRKYIAREIHDELGQLLAALHLEASLLTNKDSIQRKQLESIHLNMMNLLNRAVLSVRAVTENLRPAALNLGIAPAIRKLTSDFSKNNNIQCHLEMSDDPVGLTEEQIIMAFRIIQESLTNVTRHAKASQVKVVVLQVSGELHIEIQDNGIGFQVEKAAEKKSFGLIGMRERVSTQDGKIDITSTPQQGTLVSVNIPISPVLQN